MAKATQRRRSISGYASIRRGVVLASSAAGLFTTLNVAWATTYSWTAGGGSWSNAADWNPNGTPGAADVAIIGDTAASRIVTYDASAPANLGTVVLTQNTASFSNLLNLVQNPASFGLIDIYQTNSANGTAATMQIGNFTLNVPASSELEFGAALTTPVTGTVISPITAGQGAININGGELLAETLNTSGANFTVNVPVTMSSGAIELVGPSSISTCRLIINANFTATGGTIYDQGTNNPTLYLQGGTVAIGSGVTGSLVNPIGINSGAAQNVTVGTSAFGLLMRNPNSAAGLTSVKTLTSTANNNAIGTIEFQNGNPSSGIDGLTVKLGSNLNLVSGDATPSFVATSSTAESNILDLAGYTFDTSAGANAGLFQPTLGSASLLIPFSVNSTTLGGVFRAGSFDLSTSDTTIGSGVTLQAVGNGTSYLGVLSGGAATISGASTFLFTGSIGTLSMNSASTSASRSVGQISVGDGTDASTLNVGTAITAQGAVAINNNATLALGSNTLSASNGSILISSGAALSTASLTNSLAVEISSNSAGELLAGNGSGAITLASAGPIVLGAASTAGSNITGITGITPYNNVYRLGANGTLTVDGAALTGGSNSVIISGPVIYGTANASYGGPTLINSGATLRGSTGTRIPSATAVTIQGGGTLDLGNIDTTEYIQSVASLQGSGMVINSVANSGYNNNIRVLEVNGSTSTTFSGSINDGATSQGLTAFIKAGSSTLALTGTSGFSGGATVSGGNLAVNGAITNSAITVSGGTLSGTGSVATSLTVNSGYVAAGDVNGNGSLSTSNFTLNSGATDVVNLNGTGAGSFSQIHLVSGTATLGGNLNVNVGYAANVGDSFVILLNGRGNAINGTFANISANGPYTFSVNYADDSQSDSGNDVTLTVASVPEPSTFALVAVGGLMLARRRRIDA